MWKCLYCEESNPDEIEICQVCEKERVKLPEVNVIVVNQHAPVGEHAYFSWTGKYIDNVVGLYDKKSYDLTHEKVLKVPISEKEQKVTLVFSSLLGKVEKVYTTRKNDEIQTFSPRLVLCRRVGDRPCVGDKVEIEYAFDNCSYVQCKGHTFPPMGSLFVCAKNERTTIHLTAILENNGSIYTIEKEIIIITTNK